MVANVFAGCPGLHDAQQDLPEEEWETRNVRQHESVLAFTTMGHEDAGKENKGADTHTHTHTNSPGGTSCQRTLEGTNELTIRLEKVTPQHLGQLLDFLCWVRGKLTDKEW